ncbi:MAG TPA: CYTH domain-containing protein, partial [Vitreimonas sp.]|nr:CYTH domain-containing protein [Vitreimonas sp.]
MTIGGGGRVRNGGRVRSTDARGEAENARGALSRPIEVELKYRAKSIAAGERVLSSDELAGLTAGAATRTVQFDDRYVDTADGALARAGFAARLRTTPAGTILSVKSTSRRSDASGVHRREELEGPADRTARPNEWPVSDARSLILELCGDAPLVELVTIRQLRRRRLLRDERTTIELSLDEVDVVARSQVVDRWVELEAELVKGDEGPLLELAKILEADRDLMPARTSKLEGALAAVHAHVRRHGPLPDVKSRPKRVERATAKSPETGTASAAEPTPEPRREPTPKAAPEPAAGSTPEQ